MQGFLSLFQRVNRGYQYEEESGIGIFTFPAFSAFPFLRHGFTARLGGVSKGAYASLNLSFTRPDEKHENVMENHRLFAARAGIGWESMVMDHFEHGVTVLPVNQAHQGMGYLRDPLPLCDGLATKSPGTTLVTGHADCVPLFFVDPLRKCIALAHSGWKGTLEKIGENALRLLMEEFGCAPKDIHAGIGPCICGNCFEVSEELAARFLDAYPGVPLASPGAVGKAQLDLAMANAAQLFSVGLLPENVHIMDICTYEDAARLYSHRRDAGNTGGMIAFMQLKPQEGENAAEQKPFIDAFLQKSPTRIKA